MAKKILALVLAAIMSLTMVVMFTSCNGENDKDTFKIGLICLHDEKSTYDLNFIDAMKRAAKNVGLSDDQVVIVNNIEEGNECYEAACDLVDQGCNVIFADSFGHEDYMIKAAKEFKDVQFCHATGTKAHTENLSNYHNAFASIYEGRYLAGVAAGLKLNEMIANNKITADKAVMGYVGAFTYAEVISGYTSFYLGAKSVCPSVTMKVQFTGSWYDYEGEKSAAQNLIGLGCVLISQHADSLGAPEACEDAKVPNVSYNGSTALSGPNTYIVSSKIDWAPYFELIINNTKEDKAIPTDYVGNITTGSVVLLDVNEDVAAAGTAEKIAQVKESLVSGSLKVFDTNTFTFGGSKVTSYMADVDTDDEFTKDTEAINAAGYFDESKFRSAPYFDLRIDGIELVNEKY